MKSSLLAAQIIMYLIALDIRDLPTVRKFAVNDYPFIQQSVANVNGLKGIYSLLMSYCIIKMFASCWLQIGAKKICFALDSCL